MAQYNILNTLLKIVFSVRVLLYTLRFKVLHKKKKTIIGPILKTVNLHRYVTIILTLFGVRMVDFKLNSVGCVQGVFEAEG